MALKTEKTILAIDEDNELDANVKKYLRGEGTNLKKLKGQLAVREELYGRSAKAAAKVEKLFVYTGYRESTVLLPVFALSQALSVAAVPLMNVLSSHLRLSFSIAITLPTEFCRLLLHSSALIFNGQSPFHRAEELMLVQVIPRSLRKGDCETLLSAMLMPLGLQQTAMIFSQYGGSLRKCSFRPTCQFGFAEQSDHCTA
ncbi:hypothetical protein Ancab_023609 [Ancistrocladus abbreviatus]